MPKSRIQKPIKDVWSYNFEEEFSKVMDLLDKYTVVSIDTEFPGVYYVFL